MIRAVPGTFKHSVSIAAVIMNVNMPKSLSVCLSDDGLELTRLLRLGAERFNVQVTPSNT